MCWRLTPLASTATWPRPSTSCAPTRAVRPSRLYTVGFCIGGRIEPAHRGPVGPRPNGVIGLLPLAGRTASQPGCPPPPTRRPASDARCSRSMAGGRRASPAEARDGVRPRARGGRCGAPHGRVRGRTALVLRSPGHRLADASTAAWTEMLDFMEVLPTDDRLADDAQRERSARRARLRRARSCRASASSTRAPPTTIPLREDGRGLLGLPIPKKYSGAGMDYIAFALLCERWSVPDTAFASDPLGAHSSTP